MSLLVGKHIYIQSAGERKAEQKADKGEGLLKS